MKDRVCQSVVVLWSEGCFAGNLRLGCLSILVALCLLALPRAHCQEVEAAVAPRIPLGTDSSAVVGTGVRRTHPDGRPPEQEFAVDGDDSVWRLQDVQRHGTLQCVDGRGGVRAP